MRSLIAAVFLLSVGATQAQAENTTRTYEFENTYGQRVQCIVSRYNGVEERQIATINSSSFEVDRPPSAQTWAKSGCAAYVSS